ncbi:uncharacterized protein LOC128993260 [Macrosteles quadrilineatus]|uniref:uncharacterized protein LOC128993260 n=1 Tax=Macrosteles quadrilineatus TaxID=74068 RepID=UPI0023E1CEFA|nr:uncharacterized protein LOC128993260 [Macrosteles quadrilineatus]
MDESNIWSMFIGDQLENRTRKRQRICIKCHGIIAEEAILSSENNLVLLCKTCYAPNQCKNKLCRAMVTIEDDHGDYCDYRSTKCQLGSCSWEGSCRQLVKHFNHCIKRADIYEFSPSGYHKFYSDKPFNKDSEYTGITLYECMGNFKSLMWIKLICKDVITFSCHAVLTRRPKDEEVWFRVIYNSYLRKYEFQLRLDFDKSKQSLEPTDSNSIRILRNTWMDWLTRDRNGGFGLYFSVHGE